MILAWVPLIASAVLLAVLRFTDDLAGRTFGVLIAWFLAGAGFQFFGPSAGYSVAGLLLQSGLAVYLIFRWQLSAL